MACRGDSRGRHYSDYPGVGANASSCLHVLPCTLWRLNTQVAVFFSLSFKRLSSTAREHGRVGRAGGRRRGRTQIAFRKKQCDRSLRKKRWKSRRLHGRCQAPPPPPLWRHTSWLLQQLYTLPENSLVFHYYWEKKTQKNGRFRRRQAPLRNVVLSAGRSMSRRPSAGCR